jgi:hypothetical protein
MNQKIDYWQIVEPIWEKISIYDGYDVYLEQIARYPESHINLFATHWFYAEVTNGGFHQFYYNDSGIVVDEAIRGFRALGMTHTAALIEKTTRFFAGRDIHDRDQRIKHLEAFEQQHGGRRAPSEQWNPFYKTDFELLVESENDGFVNAADLYAALIQNENPCDSH